MRLVDADALPIVAQGKNHHRKYVFADITDAPTIEAIPVEWLRNVLEEAKEFPRVNHETIAAIPYLIYRWQKEQEAQDG